MADLRYTAYAPTRDGKMVKVATLVAAPKEAIERLATRWVGPQGILMPEGQAPEGSE